MRTSLASLLPLLSLLSGTSAFSCNATSQQDLPICCGAYIPYNTPSTPSTSNLTYAIFCAPAPAGNTTGDYMCGTTGDAVNPACCEYYETLEEMAFECQPL